MSPRSQVSAGLPDDHVSLLYGPGRFFAVAGIPSDTWLQLADTWGNAITTRNTSRIDVIVTPVHVPKPGATSPPPIDPGTWMTGQLGGAEFPAMPHRIGVESTARGCIDQHYTEGTLG